MKNIANYLTESNNDWHILKGPGHNFSYKPAAEYLWLNTEGYTYGFLTEHDIEVMGKDYDDDDFVEDILDLKPGACYDVDGGINIYIRIA